MSTYGKGRTLMLGSYVSAAAQSTPSAAAERFFAGLLEWAGVTLPLMVFLMLGTLQLFLMMQARMLAEYSAFWAVRSGSVNHGECARMLDAAVLAVLPAITRTNSPQNLASGFAQ